MRTSPENTVSIDGTKLYEQFKERGLFPTRVSTAIGVSVGYFSRAKRRGSMATMMTVLLESRYGIPKSTYVIEDEKPETTVVEVVPKEDFFSEENMKKLYKLMYSAMYNAMKQALSE